MVLPMHSQNISIKENRVRTFVNEKGDTLVQMCYKDAKILLTDVLEYKYADSLLGVYKVRDSLNTKTVTMQKDVIVKLTTKVTNFETIIANLNKVIANKDEEITLKDKTIKQQKKEIRKQKLYKVLGIAGSVILPILTLLAGG